MTTIAGHSFYIGPIYSFYNQVNDTGSWEPLVLFYYVAFWSCDMVRKSMCQTTQKVNKHWHGRKGWEKESNTIKGAR
jgi:hypothetical protein